MVSYHYVWLPWSTAFLVLWGSMLAIFPDERQKCAEHQSSHDVFRSD